MTTRDSDPRFSAAMTELVLEALALVAAANVEHWPGCWGRHEGFTYAGGQPMPGALRAALHHAWHAQLITAPAREPYYATRPVRLTVTGRRWLRARQEPTAADMAQPG
jgi:hypothetical protein